MTSLAVELGHRETRPQGLLEPGQGERVDPPAGPGKVALGQERGRRLGEADRLDGERQHPGGHDTPDFAVNVRPSFSSRVTALTRICA